MKRRTSRLLRVGLALLLLLAAGTVLWRLFASDPAADAIPVTLAAARATTLRARVVGSCEFSPRRSVTVVSDAGGRVVAIPVTVGEAVAVGQELVLLDDRQRRIALSQAEAAQRAAESGVRRNLVSLRSDLRSAASAWAQARDALARQQELHRSGGVTRKQLEEAVTEERTAGEALRAAREQLNLATGRPLDAEPVIDATGDAAVIDAAPDVIQARLTVDQAARDFAQAALTAPLAGTLTALPASLGNHLAAGAEAATVATLDDIVAEVEIDEVDIGKLRVGQRVLLTTDSVRDVELQGRISLIPPAMSNNVVTVQVDVDESGLPAGVHLRAGASCRARVEAELKRDVTAVPFAALLERPGGAVAFVAVPAEEAEDAEQDAGLYRLQRRDVKLGASSVTEVEVTDGVKEGELVAVGNLSLLRDGLLVTREAEEDVTEGGTADDARRALDGTEAE